MVGSGDGVLNGDKWPVLFPMSAGREGTARRSFWSEHLRRSGLRHQEDLRGTGRRSQRAGVSSFHLHFSHLTATSKQWATDAHHEAQSHQAVLGRPPSALWRTLQKQNKKITTTVALSHYTRSQKDKSPKNSHLYSTKSQRQ